MKESPPAKDRCPTHWATLPAGTSPPHLRTERRLVVEISAAEIAVFARGDDTVALHADAARSTGDRTRHVTQAQVFRRHVLRLVADLPIKSNIDNEFSEWPKY